MTKSLVRNRAMGSLAHSSSDDNDEDVSLASFDEPAKKRKTEKLTWKWRKQDIQTADAEENKLIPTGIARKQKNPLKLFSIVFDRELIEILLLESNGHRLHWTNTRDKVISMEEMRSIIGILIHMTVVDLPQRRMYWSP